MAGAPEGRAQDRWVRVRPRTVLQIAGLVIAVWALLHVLSVAREVIISAFVALFLALAINPLVEWLKRPVVARRGLAVTLAVLLVLIGDRRDRRALRADAHRPDEQVRQAAPDYVDDLTKGRGRLGFLETKYHIVEKARGVHRQRRRPQGLRVLGHRGRRHEGVLNIVVATITIFVMTFFMLLEGPAGWSASTASCPEQSQPRWRAVGRDIYRTVGGYVTGNLLISLIAGVTAAIVLLILGVPFAVALGLLVAILDLIPLAGATIAAVIVCAVGFLHSLIAGHRRLVFWFIVYQQLENHLLQPAIYGRTVKISPLVVLIAVLIGAKLAGILGALGAIPVAGAIQILIVDALGGAPAPGGAGSCRGLAPPNPRSPDSSSVASSAWRRPR